MKHVHAYLSAREVEKAIFIAVEDVWGWCKPG